jgi:hypothetical protein
MATFPTLKTGAVAQYPLPVSTRHSTQAVQFLDGSRQTFQLYPAPLRRWSVQLDGLDETELDLFISFVEGQGGTPFSFTDPVSGSVVANCMISGNETSVTRENSGQTQFVIEEVA